MPEIENKSDDSFTLGCAFGCCSQLIVAILGVIVSAFIDTHNRAVFVVYNAWGFTQWLAIIPLILSEKKKHHPKTIQGLILTGSLGLLLSSACASIMLHNP